MLMSYVVIYVHLRSLRNFSECINIMRAERARSRMPNRDTGTFVRGNARDNAIADTRSKSIFLFLSPSQPRRDAAHAGNANAFADEVAKGHRRASNAEETKYAIEIFVYVSLPFRHIGHSDRSLMPRAHLTSIIRENFPRDSSRTAREFTVFGNTIIPRARFQARIARLR